MGVFVEQHDQFLHWDINAVNITLYTKTIFLFIIFCSLLIILIVLFFYSYRACHLHHRSSTSATSITTDTTTVIQWPPQWSYGLDPSIIDSLPVTLYLSWVKSKHNMETRANYMQTECSICLCGFEDEDKLKVLPECNHAYHCDCLDKWLSSRSSCPLCRASLEISLDEIVISSETSTGN